MRSTRLFAAGVAVSLCGSLAAAAEPASKAASDSFILERLTVAVLAGRATSSSFRTTVTAAEAEGSAGVCPAGTATTLGFWSILGPQSVPVLLDVEKNSTTPNDADLSWTGQAARFDVYRSGAPANLESPSNLLVSSAQCQATDTDTAGWKILYYSVVPSILQVPHEDFKERANP